VLKIARTGRVTVVVSKHEAAHGIRGATFSGFGNVEVDGAGRTLMLATVAGQGLTRANDVGIWTCAGSKQILLAQTGKPAPGVPGSVFTGLGEPVMNSKGCGAFLGTLNTNQSGIWTNTSGAVRLVALTQAQAPGCPAGAVLSAIQTMALPDQGGPVILAALAPGTGGVTSANNSGIWQADSNGNLTLIARTGDSIEIDGNVRFITGIAIFNGTTETMAQPGGCNAHGDLIYRLTLDDGTQALVTSITGTHGGA